MLIFGGRNRPDVNTNMIENYVDLMLAIVFPQNIFLTLSFLLFI